MIAILDYERGNLKSVSKALEAVGAPYQVTKDPSVIARTDKLIVPGVGAFKDCMTNLEQRGLVQPIKDFLASGRPYLGICLGLQILMEESEEGGSYPGLGVFKGKVLRFSPELKLKVPHMGWNALHKQKDSRLLEGIEDQSYVYFVHSYYAEPKQKKLNASTTDYGIEFTSCLEQENIFAVQFHPEKSQKVGLQLLRNFHQRI